jgi:hypothetical protein
MVEAGLNGRSRRRRGRTAASPMKAGEADALRDDLDALATGGFA